MTIQPPDGGGAPRAADGERRFLRFPPEAAPRGIYQFLISVVVPRPVAWVSSRSPDGVLNLAPHSYFTVVSHKPPMLGFTSVGEKDTLRNVRATGEYVINVASDDLVERMNLTSADFPPPEDEFAWAGLTPEPSSVVAVPAVGEAPVSLEMRLREIKPFGDCFLIAGEVVHVRLAADVVRDDRVAPDLLRPLARGTGATFFRNLEAFDLPRPKYAQLLADGVRPVREGETGLADVAFPDPNTQRAPRAE
jgi:flavin reductase (DIM6/NTAB) family NADH-FMN oxidoreductase RutF